MCRSALKDAINRRKRGIPLARAGEMDFVNAGITEDEREDYGETRYRAIGFLKERLFVLIFTETETGIRAISLRKALKSEMKAYDEER